jgi:mono/diheme cytochrome c family protein
MKLRNRLTTVCLPAVLYFGPLAKAQDSANAVPKVSYPGGSRSTLLLEADGRRYIVDLAAGTVRPAQAGPQSFVGQPASGQPASGQPAGQPAAGLFAQNCSACHGPDGRGIRAIGTPDFTDPSIQASLGDPQIASTIRNGKGNMPAWAGRLTDAQITELTAYIRSFARSGSGGPTAAAGGSKSGVYQPGDDVLFSLPTGRPVDRHGVYVNFSHRFPYNAAFTGPARGEELLGMDNFALSSFGFRYGVTDKFSVDVWRSPSFIGRPIQLMAAYNLLGENHGAPLNLAVRVSIEGQNNFRKNFTENIEAIVSRSLTSRAQIYFVPTASFNDRRLVQGGLLSSDIPDLPGINAFSLGSGLAVDILPTVALVAEVIPTVAGARELGIHRPPFAIGIQKKIYRHAFTFGFTTGPGTTVSQRAGTSATFLDDPSADTPAGLFIGFNLTRQIH